MTNYVMDREKLKEVLLAHKTYISQRVQQMIAQGVDVSKITYGESKKLTDEFIDTYINKLPVDELLDQIDDALVRVGAKTSKQMLKEKGQNSDNI